MSAFDQIVEKKILAAMEEGAFDNLPGVGRSIEWDDDSMVAEDMRMAYHLLKSNGFTLPWVAERREIEQELATACQSLARAQGRYREARRPERTEADWRQACEVFCRQIERLNGRILNYNLVAPSTIVRRRPVDVEDELRRILGTVDGELL